MPRRDVCVGGGGVTPSPPPHAHTHTKSVKEVLKDLHDKYVVTPINKANWNVALICKEIYALNLFREFKITSNQQIHMNVNSLNAKLGVI